MHDLSLALMQLYQVLSLSGMYEDHTCMPGRPPTGEGAFIELLAGEPASLLVRLRLTGCLAFSGSSMRSRPSLTL